MKKLSNQLDFVLYNGGVWLTKKYFHLVNFMKIKRSLFSCLVAVTCMYGSASAGDMMSFENWRKSSPNWVKDESELAYALTRCGVLFPLVGVYLTENGTKDDKITGESLIEDGNNMLRIGVSISTQNGMSEEAVRRRHKIIMDAYVGDILRNKSINNNFLHGDTGADAQFCGTINKSIK